MVAIAVIGTMGAAAGGWVSRANLEGGWGWGRRLNRIMASSPKECLLGGRMPATFILTPECGLYAALRLQRSVGPGE